MPMWYSYNYAAPCSMCDATFMEAIISFPSTEFSVQVYSLPQQIIRTSRRRQLNLVLLLSSFFRNKWSTVSYVMPLTTTIIISERTYKIVWQTSIAWQNKKHSISKQSFYRFGSYRSMKIGKSVPTASKYIIINVEMNLYWRAMHILYTFPFLNWQPRMFRYSSGDV